jgi:hypothetical protein
VYELRRYAEPSAATHPGDIRVSETGGIYSVDTGAATFELDPASPALLRTIRRSGQAVYRHVAGAGPRVVDGRGSPLAPRVDAGSFALEEAGPVKVVARLRGHFASAGGGCGQDLGYVVRLTFERASSDLGVQFQVVNECGDGHTPSGQLANGAPWWNRAYRVNGVSWRFPLASSNDAHAVAGGASASFHRNRGDGAAVVVEQERGGRGPTYRAARISQAGATIESGEYFDSPFVAYAAGGYTALLQTAWMRFREPQALVADGSILSFAVISQPATIGEAQGVWSFARLSIAEGGATNGLLQALRDRGRVALERGLLVHVPVAYLDATGVMPPLAPRRAGGDPLYRRFRDALATVHDDTIRRGGQWDRQKMFGFTAWPDYTAADERATVSQPADSSPSSNYWSATSAELTQWLVDGDPKWVWDFALPQEYTQLVTNYYNLGTRNNEVDVNYRGGFTVVAGSRAVEGEAFRSGWGSDDYSYNQASDQAYLVRPDAALVDRFAAAADTFIRRYGGTNIPARDQRRRDEGLQALRIGRAQAQHVNALSYAAQFSAAGGERYFRALTSVMDEYVADNLKGGIFCQADYGNEQSCLGTWGSYHFVALQLGAFMDFLYWMGADDARGAAIARAIPTTGEMYYRVLMRPSRDGTIDPSGPWYGVLECTFGDAGSTLRDCRGRDAEEPVYAHERPAALAFVLLASRMTGNQAICLAAESALPGALAAGLDYFTPGLGWNKGAAQAAHMIPHGLAATPCTASLP